MKIGRETGSEIQLVLKQTPARVNIPAPQVETEHFGTVQVINFKTGY